MPLRLRERAIGSISRKGKFTVSKWTRQTARLARQCGGVGEGPTASPLDLSVALRRRNQPATGACDTPRTRRLLRSWTKTTIRRLLFFQLDLNFTS